MEKYLSIGEVSKIKGISIKSLRYYDKLGIFPPAYINKETGYRYYTSDQFAILDLIMTCLDLDIPLKNFKTYLLNDTSIDIEKFLLDAQNIIEKRFIQLNKSHIFIETMLGHIQRTNTIKSYKNKFVQHISERYFLTANWSGNSNNITEISFKYSQMFKQCSEYAIPIAFNQGLLILNQEHNYQQKVFSEIPYNIESIQNLVIIPEGNYSCEIIYNTQLPNYLKQIPPTILIIKELFDLQLYSQETQLLEIQTLLN